MTTDLCGELVMVILGIETFLQNANISKSWGTCALVCNQSSWVRYTGPPLSTAKVLQEVLGPRLCLLFAPQHGYFCTEQDNMIESGHGVHEETGLPIFSLYSQTRKPPAESLVGIDTILIDLPVVGCRVYTFKYTLAECLRAAKESGKRVVVFDRPNPVGGQWIEGPCLATNRHSFVGQFPIPMRHALSMGEFARFCNLSIQANLDVIPLQNWDLQPFSVSHPWSWTSPNLPTVESVQPYPGMVLFEGTNLSEGRGTTLPFQIAGAPYLPSAVAYAARVRELLPHKGYYLRPLSFIPTSNKWMGEVCNGVQIHLLTHEQAFPIFSLGLALIKAAYDIAGEAMKWKEPPYEYEFIHSPMELIVGQERAREEILQLDLSRSFWTEGHSEYQEQARKILLYGTEKRFSLP